MLLGRLLGSRLIFVARYRSLPTHIDVYSTYLVYCLKYRRIIPETDLLVICNRFRLCIDNINKNRTMQNNLSMIYLPNI